MKSNKKKKKMLLKIEFFDQLTMKIIYSHRSQFESQKWMMTEYNQSSGQHNVTL